MKNNILMLLLITSSASAYAQGVFSNQTNNALEKVIQDYPSQFNNIKGQLINAGTNQSEYKSTINIPGALSSTITLGDDAQSWQSVLYSGKKFNEAKNRFEAIFAQIKNTIVKITGEKPLIINGEYKNPEETNTTVIFFDLLPRAQSVQKMNIGLALRNTNGEWKVVLNVSDKEKQESIPVK